MLSKLSGGSAVSFLLIGAGLLLNLANALSEVEKNVDALTLSTEFDPIIEAYWTGLPHHRRTPFAVSPDGTSAYLAYLSAPDYDSVVIQKLNPTTFAADGDAVTIQNVREAGGLVAHDDGFAVLVNVDADISPIPTIYRYTDGVQTFATPIGGPGVHEDDGITYSPDMNGDLVFSETAGLYGAYVVVDEDFDGTYHFGDSIQYVDTTGSLQTITGASSTFGCSHNTGIAIEASDSAPFATVCAEDQGSIWLNTETGYMSGVKIANENTTNGVSGEPMGGMGGSYSNLASFGDEGANGYVFAWQSRGALDLTQNEWLGGDYTACSPRWLNHNVAIAVMSSKTELLGTEAISEVGATQGDSQVNWITESDTDDHQNVRVATFDSSNALVTWELLSNPTCEPVPLSCSGTFGGTYLQQVDSTGTKVGDAVVVDDAYVAGDIVKIGEKLCWPYVSMDWDLSAPKANGTYVSAMSFACISADGSGNSTTTSSSAASSAATSVAVSSSSSIIASSTAFEVEASSTGASSVAATLSSTAIGASSSASSVAAPAISSGSETGAIEPTRSFALESGVELSTSSATATLGAPPSAVTTSASSSVAIVTSVSKTSVALTSSKSSIANSDSSVVPSVSSSSVPLDTIATATSLTTAFVTSQAQLTVTKTADSNPIPTASVAPSFAVSSVVSGIFPSGTGAALPSGTGAFQPSGTATFPGFQACSESTECGEGLQCVKTRWGMSFCMYGAHGGFGSQQEAQTEEAHESGKGWWKAYWSVN